MPRPQDLISRGLLGTTAVTLASKGFIAGILIEAEIVIPDGVKWDEAGCTWDTTTMFWDYARTHACVAIEKALVTPGTKSGGMIPEFVLYVPFEKTEPKKKKRYIKLTCKVEEVKYIEKKEVREDIKITPKDVDMLIHEALIKLEVITDKQDKELV